MIPMSILSWIGGLFTPAAQAIDKLVTSDAERMELANAMAKIQAEIQIKMLEYDNKVLELQGKILEAAAQVAIAESKSESAFVRNYKPVIITGMFLIISANYMGLLKEPIPEIFIQVFGTAFGVITVGPSLINATKPVIGKLFNKEGK